MTCEFCDKKLRADNKIGACRKHRALSAARKAYMTDYASQNVIEITAYKKQWGNKTKSIRAANDRARRKTDTQFKLKGNIRTRLNRAIESEFRTGSAIESLGCSIADFKKYIESQWEPGMSWENWTRNGWHIDHIRPLCTFDLADLNQLKQACHFTNLRPMWAVLNLKRPKRI